MHQETVQLVNEQGDTIGSIEKLEAHQKALLHRAVSVFVFNSQGEILLQKRAATKYHSPGLWSNTCCTHPRPKELSHAAASRRLIEEMGLYCPLSYHSDVIYRAELDNNLVEYEFDHIFTGISDASPSPNVNEVVSWKFLSVETISRLLEHKPSIFTMWFPILFKKLKEEL